MAKKVKKLAIKEVDVQKNIKISKINKKHFLGKLSTE